MFMENESGILNPQTFIQMTTGKKAASEASKELKGPKSTKGEKTVAGSDLVQAKKVIKNVKTRG